MEQASPYKFQNIYSARTIVPTCVTYFSRKISPTSLQNRKRIFFFKTWKMNSFTVVEIKPREEPKSVLPRYLLRNKMSKKSPRATSFRNGKEKQICITRGERKLGRSGAYKFIPPPVLANKGNASLSYHTNDLSKHKARRWNRFARFAAS